MTEVPSRNPSQTITPPTEQSVGASKKIFRCCITLSSYIRFNDRKVQEIRQAQNIGGCKSRRKSMGTMFRWIWAACLAQGGMHGKGWGYCMIVKRTCLIVFPTDFQSHNIRYRIFLAPLRLQTYPKLHMPPSRIDLSSPFFCNILDDFNILVVAVVRLWGTPKTIPKGIELLDHGIVVSLTGVAYHVVSAYAEA